MPQNLSCYTKCSTEQRQWAAGSDGAGRRQLLRVLLGVSRTSHIKLFQVEWGNAFLQQAVEDTGRVIPSILTISKGDKSSKNPTPSQTSRSTADNE